jgi:hypothetical protein
MRTQTNDVIASLFLCGKEMEDSGQCVSRKFNNLSASILHNERERKCNLCKYRYQGIAQVRTNKSSATSHENASRSSSWFRFNDGIPVLVHCLFLLESAFFFVDDCHACNTILNTHFLYFFGHRGEGGAYDDFEEGKKTDIRTVAHKINTYIYIYIMSKIRSRVIAVLCC